MSGVAGHITAEQVTDTKWGDDVFPGQVLDRRTADDARHESPVRGPRRHSVHPRRPHTRVADGPSGPSRPPHPRAGRRGGAAGLPGPGAFWPKPPWTLHPAPDARP